MLITYFIRLSFYCSQICPVRQHTLPLDYSLQHIAVCTMNIHSTFHERRSLSLANPGFDTAFLVTGGVIVVGLLVLSVLLYMADSWATARSVLLYMAEGWATGRSVLLYMADSWARARSVLLYIAVSWFQAGKYSSTWLTTRPLPCQNSSTCLYSQVGQYSFSWLGWAAAGSVLLHS